MRDTLVLARHHNRRIEAGKAEVTKALTGNWRDEHLFLLKQSLAILDDLAKRVQECDAEIEALLAPLQRHAVQLKASLKDKGKNNPAFDVRQAMANWAGVDLTRIDGLGVSIVMKLLSEIGADLSRFADVEHFCSWLRLCPGTQRSANRARQALKMAAMSLPAATRRRARSTAGCAHAWTSPGPTPPWPTSSDGWRTSCGRAARSLSTKAASSTRSSSAAIKRRAAALGFQLAPAAAAA